MREATRPPVLQCFREERPHVLRESSPGRVAGCGAGQGHSGRACPRPGFLEGARDIWLSRSATSSVAPVPFFSWVQLYTWLPRGLAVKNAPADAGETGSIPGLGRSPGGGSGSPLQYACLENPLDRGAWWATVHEVATSRTRLSE